MRYYIGLIHKDGDSDFGVSFPDLPGVITAGKSLDEARAMAEEALAFHIEGLVADGEAIPEPSSLEDVIISMNTLLAFLILVHQAPSNWQYPQECCKQSDCRPIPCEKIVTLDSRCKQYEGRNYCLVMKSQDNQCHECHPDADPWHGQCLFIKPGETS